MRTPLDYSIAKETGGDYAGLYGARVWTPGRRESTTFVLGHNASIHATYDDALDWVERRI